MKTEAEMTAKLINFENDRAAPERDIGWWREEALLRATEQRQLQGACLDWAEANKRLGDALWRIWALCDERPTKKTMKKIEKIAMKALDKYHHEI